MSPVVIALFYVIGMALVLVEIVTPGIVLGLIGLVFLGVAVHGTFSYGVLQGIVGLAATIGFLGATALYAVRRLTLHKTQDASRGYASSDPTLADLVGREGHTLSPLRPTGLCTIEGRRLSVVSRGEPIDADARVRVVEVEGNRVVVRRA